MQHSYSRAPLARRLVLLLWLLAAGTARAQAPVWAAAAVGSPDQCYGASQTWAVATDASGNVFVTGSFTGSIAFGSTVLTCVPGFTPTQSDLFVAKWVPATGTWAWAVRGGGGGDDIGRSIAVSGSSVYVTGHVTNNATNTIGVTLGGAGATSLPVRGASATTSMDIVLAKYTDQGSRAALAWVQVAGGTGDDVGYGVAVQGTSVYVAGSFSNNAANASAVLLGGDGTTAGTVPVNGASATTSLDFLLAKYTDQGSRATVAWAQVGGGSGDDFATGLAVNGASIYAVGAYENSQSDSRGVVFGGDGSTPGTVPLRGSASASGRNLLLVKYTDGGAAGTYAWGQVGGNAQGAVAQRVAVSGSSLYVAATFLGNTTNATGMVLGGDGTTAGTVPVNGASATVSQDVLLLKYTDQGSTGQYRWSQVGGGTGSDQALSVAASGSNVYLVSHCLNNVANGNAVVFGGNGTTAGTAVVAGVATLSSYDVVLTKYTDTGATGAYGWSQAGGGAGDDYGVGVAVGGGQVYTAGFVNYVSTAPAYAFGAGSDVLSSTINQRGLVASATDGGGTGSWGALAVVFNGGGSTPRAVATDASGNVFVTGGFTGQVRFGSTVLTSAGGQDVYVAKWVPATGTWAWAVRGGGTEGDLGYGIAVQGSSIYVTGAISNNAANANAVTLNDTQGGRQPLAGASPVISIDLLLAKYTDQGSTAALNWTQVAGGSSTDLGYGVAVSGSSVYVTGQLTNNAANATAVVFGGSGLTAGTSPQAGATASTGLDLLLAKYTDQGSTAALAWTQVAGGTSTDGGLGVAVSGSNIYVTGFISNDLSNTTAVVFGGSGLAAGAQPQAGATTTTSGDLLLAKYTDNGAAGAFDWSQVGGGTQGDAGQSVAVRGNNVYVAGLLRNNMANAQMAVFGGSGLVAGTAAQFGASTNPSFDLLLAKYTDQGSTGRFGWSQVGGGTGNDQALGVAVVGSRVYVAGQLSNDLGNSASVVFGGSGPIAGTAAQAGVANTVGADVLLARYTDQGTAGAFDWSQVGGSAGADAGCGVVVNGQQVRVAATVYAGATFGSTVLAPPSSTSCTAVAALTDTALPLFIRPAAHGGLTLFPNPSGGSTTLLSEAAYTPVQVFDALGRVVVITKTDAGGTARLAGLAPGLYVVRVGATSVRLAAR